MFEDECVLCGQLDDRGGGIEMGSGLMLTADAAPLQPGHVLLHTIQHLPSFALASDDIVSAAGEALHKLLQLGRYASGPVLIFEHGTTGPTGGSGCVDHAHIHVVPVSDRSRGLYASDPSFPVALATSGPSLPFDRLSSLAGEAYFWVAGRTLKLTKIVPHSEERQVLRRVVAGMLGLPHFQTWELFDIEAALATTEELRSLFGKGSSARHAT